jgi:hypothetical protein
MVVGKNRSMKDLNACEDFVISMMKITTNCIKNVEFNNIFTNYAQNIIN